MSLAVESELEEGRADLGLVGIDPGLLDHEVEDGDAALVALNVVLDVGRLKVHREVVDLLAVDRLEQRRLSTSVRSTHAVAVTAAELERRVVKKE